MLSCTLNGLDLSINWAKIKNTNDILTFSQADVSMTGIPLFFFPPALAANFSASFTADETASSHLVKARTTGFFVFAR